LGSRQNPRTRPFQLSRLLASMSLDDTQSRNTHAQPRGRGADGVLMPGSDDSLSPTVAVGKSKLIRGDESCAFVSDGEAETFRGRHKALGKALSVAMDELEEECTVLQNLVDLFDQCRSAYPEEHTQCFASLGLAMD